MRIGRRQFVGSGIGSIALAMIRPIGAQSPSLDVALVGRVVWTGNPDQPRTDAIGIVGDRIAAVGNDAARAAITSKTQVVPLRGVFAMPALSTTIPTS